MKPFWEQIDLPADASWRYFINAGESFPFHWHFHGECEMTLVLAGSGVRLIGASAQPYQRGDLVLIGPDLPHTYVSAPGQPAAASVAQFRTDFLGESLLRRPEFAGVGVLLRAAQHGIAFTAAGEVDDPTSAAGRFRGLGARPPAERTVALLDLLITLAEHPRERLLSQAENRPISDDPRAERVARIRQFLQAAHHREVSLAEIAEVAHLSLTSTSRFFQQATGRSLTSYLTQLRVESAARLLAETELSVTEIGERAGFRNQSYFNRRFLSVTGLQPRSYRKLFRAGRPD